MRDRFKAVAAKTELGGKMLPRGMDVGDLIVEQVAISAAKANLGAAAMFITQVDGEGPSASELAPPIAPAAAEKILNAASSDDWQEEQSAP